LLGQRTLDAGAFPASNDYGKFFLLHPLVCQVI
jgi:hypothetical protein